MDLDVGGEAVHLLAAPAVWWPSRRTLLVADVHLGKTETFRALGRALPGGELEETLTRLGCVIAAVDAARVIVLGDLVHGRIGVTDELADRVERWRHTTDVSLVLVRGNHDRHLDSLPSTWGIDERDGPVVEGPFAFVHEPREVEGAYTWAGHVHPAAIVGKGRSSLKLPAFHLGARVGIVPAFSRFSGGAARLEHDPEAGRYAIAGDEVFPLPAPTASRGGRPGRRRAG